MGNTQGSDKTNDNLDRKADIINTETQQIQASRNKGYSKIKPQRGIMLIKYKEIWLNKLTINKLKCGENYRK